MERRKFINLVVKSIGLTGFIIAYRCRTSPKTSNTNDDISTKKVTASPLPEVWSEKNLVVNKNSNVVHWPHPDVSKLNYKVAPHNSEKLEVLEVKN